MMFGNDLPTPTLGSMDIRLPIAKGCCNEQLPPLQTGRVREELPTVYDEALSYQEAIASILEKVNQLVGDSAIISSPTAGSWEKAASAGVKCVSQSDDGKVVFNCDEVPETDLSFVLMIFNQ